MIKGPITFDRMARWILIAAAVVATIFILSYLSNVLLPFFVALVFAYLLYPLVKFIQYRLKVRIRVLSVVLAMLVGMAILAGVVYLIIPPMIEEFTRFTSLANRYLHHITNISNFPETAKVWIEQNSAQIEEFLKSDKFSDTVKDTAPTLVNMMGQSVQIILSLAESLIAILYLFFILLDYEYLSNNWIKIFPKESRPFWKDLMKDVESALSNYIRGQGSCAMIMGILFCIGFSIIDFPMAIGLGVLVGIMDLVPYLHGFALIPAAFLAGLKAAETGQNFFVIFGMVLAIFGIVQVIMDAIVVPKVMGKHMGLNPTVLLLSLSVWGALLGFIGLIIALPATTLLMAYWRRYVTKEEQDNG